MAIGIAPAAAADSSAQSAVLATAVTGQSQPGVDMFVRAAEASVDQFAAENHLSTVTWHNLTSLETSTNPCGYASASFAYYYCPVDRVAYIGVSQEAFFNDGTHYLAGSLLIAHEWGHYLQHGCTVHEKATETGDDIVVATVKKPNSQLLGLIYNPHFKP